MAEDEVHNFAEGLSGSEGYSEHEVEESETVLSDDVKTFVIHGF